MFASALALMILTGLPVFAALVGVACLFAAFGPLMAAHTQAVRATDAAVRIVNTQDLMRAALVPGALVLALALAWVAWRDRGAPRTTPLRLRRSELALAVGIVLAIVVLLGAVAIGRL